MKFVLIGSGNIANTYVNAVKNMDNAEIVGVISRSIDRAKKYADENSLGEAAVSLKEIKSDFDAVLVATPNGSHHAGAIAAAEAGKHALVEKPLDITTANIDKMISACKNAGVKLGVTYQRRLSKNNMAIKKLLDEKAFGKIYAVDLPLKLYRGQDYYDSGAWRGTFEFDGGGPFMQQGSHDIDLLGWFFGMPKKVFAKTGTFGHTGIEVEDHGAAIMELEDGAICSVLASTIARPGFSPRLDVFTEKGTFSLENDAITTWDIEGIDNPDEGVAEKRHSSASSAAVSDTSGHENVINDFIEAIENDREPAANGEAGKLTSEIILAIYRSAKEGREIVVSE
ncbi:MAG: Gfo/Idh/MocA family protein [Planctomycetota bacterium]|jgi:predicted dehydrogenase